MSKEFDEYIADKPGLNLISKEDVALLKIKLGKSHRKQSDWDIIKGILTSHDVITAAPMKKMKAIGSIDHILCENGTLFVFTNMDDCERHLRALQDRYGDIGQYFEISSLWFEDAIQAAHENCMNVLIDMQDELNCKCMMYYYEEELLKAVTMARF